MAGGRMGWVMVVVVLVWSGQAEAGNNVAMGAKVDAEFLARHPQPDPHLSDKVDPVGTLPPTVYPVIPQFSFPPGSRGCAVIGEDGKPVERVRWGPGSKFRVQAGRNGPIQEIEIPAAELKSALVVLDEQIPTVLTVGAGPTGIMAAILARLTHTHDVVIDRSPWHGFSGNEQEYYVFKREQILRLDDKSLKLLKTLKTKHFRNGRSVYDALVEINQVYNERAYDPPGTLINPGLLSGTTTTERLIHVKINVLMAVLTEFYMSIPWVSKQTTHSPLYKTGFNQLLHIELATSYNDVTYTAGALLETEDAAGNTVCYLMHFRQLIGADGVKSAVRKTLSKHLMFLREKSPLIDNILTTKAHMRKTPVDTTHMTPEAKIVHEVCGPDPDDFLYDVAQPQELSFGAVGYIEEDKTNLAGAAAHPETTNINNAYFTFCDLRYCYGTDNASPNVARHWTNTVGTVVRAFHSEPFYHPLISGIESMTRSGHYLGLGVTSSQLTAMQAVYEKREKYYSVAPARNNKIKFASAVPTGVKNMISFWTGVGKGQRGSKSARDAPISFDDIKPEMVALMDDVRDMLKIKGTNKCVDRWPSVFPICVYRTAVVSWSLHPSSSPTPPTAALRRRAGRAAAPNSPPIEGRYYLRQYINIEGDAARGPNFLTWGGANSAWDALQSGRDVSKREGNALEYYGTPDRNGCYQLFDNTQCHDMPISAQFIYLVQRNPKDQECVATTKLAEKLQHCKNLKSVHTTDHLLEKGTNCNLALTAMATDPGSYHDRVKALKHTSGGYFPTCTPLVHLDGGNLRIPLQAERRSDSQHISKEIYNLSEYTSRRNLERLDALAGSSARVFAKWVKKGHAAEASAYAEAGRPKLPDQYPPQCKCLGAGGASVGCNA